MPRAGKAQNHGTRIGDEMSMTFSIQYYYVRTYEPTVNLPIK